MQTEEIKLSNHKAKDAVRIFPPYFLGWINLIVFMNWTTRNPIEKLKCLVETEAGKVFPAQYVKGRWLIFGTQYPLSDVKRWIVYPEGESPNDYIAPEVLLKYAMQSYRSERAKLASTRRLNRELYAAYEKERKRADRLAADSEKLKEDLKMARKQARKGKTLHGNLVNLLKQSAILEDGWQNNPKDEIVA